MIARPGRDKQYLLQPFTRTCLSSPGSSPSAAPRHHKTPGGRPPADRRGDACAAPVMFCSTWTVLLKAQFGGGVEEMPLPSAVLHGKDAFTSYDDTQRPSCRPIHQHSNPTSQDPPRQCKSKT